MVIGYTCGVYDLFHSGHVRLLRNARSLCDKLIVGVSVDELVSYKGKQAVIPFDQRIEVVSSCRFVDVAVPQYSLDKVDAVKKLKASRLFVGDDWYGDKKWEQYEKLLADMDCLVIYFPYTRDTSSTLINSTLQRLRYGY